MWKKKIEKSKKKFSTNFPQTFPQVKCRKMLNEISFPQFSQFSFPQVDKSFPQSVETVENHISIKNLLRK